MKPSKCECGGECRTPPHEDEIEVTVLGRGVGESVVIHTGGGGWVIVDSFCEHGTVDAAPLIYLRRLGIETNEQVTAVVLSHLHADHYRKIDRVVEECSSAWFYLPGVLTGDSWREILKHADEMEDGPYRQAGQVAAALVCADDSGRLRAVGPDSEIETRRESSLRCIGPTSAALNADVRTRGPSAALLNRLYDEANYTSTVLWLKVDEIRALLCADFDAADDDLGWSALMREQGSKPWIAGASLVKVPHHGSNTAHHEALYRTWCTDPIAVISTNWTSRLPDDDVVRSLQDDCLEIHLTSSSASPVPATATTRPKGRKTPTGSVTARRRPGETLWRVCRSGPAHQAYPGVP